MSHSTKTSRTSAEEQRQEQILKNQRVIDFLNAWESEDENEQRDTLAFLMRALDEDRPSGRKLFA